MSCNWNEANLTSLPSINWRASLVPAAAVIPAPIAYIKVVAVKKLVVGFLMRIAGPGLLALCTGVFLSSLWGTCLALVCRAWEPHHLL